MSRRHLTSTRSPVVQRVVKLANHAAARRQSGCVVLHGATLLREALATPAPARRGWPLPSALPVADVEAVFLGPEAVAEECTGPLQSALQSAAVFTTSPAVHKRVSGVVSPHPAGLTAVVRLPPPVPVLRAGNPLAEPGVRGLLVLDAVADAGNVGTLLRACLCLGWRPVVTTGCADVGSPKVLRASQAAPLRMPVATATWKELAVAAETFAWRGWVADAGGARVAAGLPTQPGVLVVGNEARGVSDAARAVFSDAVRVPMAPGCDSLNVSVAAGVLMHTLGAPPSSS